MKKKASQEVEAPADNELTILVYSHDRDVRQAVIRAIGSRLLPHGPGLRYREFATEPAAMRCLDEGGIDLVILDGEATPVGGMGMARQIKDEIDNGPPVLLLTGRPDDDWLATWSRAEAVVERPINSVDVLTAVRALLREHLGAVPSAAWRLPRGQTLSAR